MESYMQAHGEVALKMHAACGKKEDAELTVGCFPDVELILMEHKH